MTTRVQIDPKQSIRRGASLPTSTTVAVQTVEHLDKLVGTLERAGHRASRRDVVAIAVLFSAPTNLDKALVSYRARHREHASRSLMLLLPVPVTIRIDELVTAVRREGGDAYRQDIVGALISLVAPAKKSLVRNLERYSRMRACDVLLDVGRAGDVLHIQKPKAGPRPMPF